MSFIGVETMTKTIIKLHDSFVEAFYILWAFDKTVELKKKGKSVIREEDLNRVAQILTDVYVQMRDRYCKEIAEGKIEAFTIIFNAIQTNALDFPWFKKVLGNLIDKGRVIQLAIPPFDTQKETELFLKMDKLITEIRSGKNIVEAAANDSGLDWENNPISKLKTNLYRDYPKKLQIYFFRKLHFSLMNYLMS